VDLLVSISTLEHVEARPAVVLERMRSFLAPGGVGVVTVPTGYREDLDEELRAGAMQAARVWPMMHVADPGSRGPGMWGECTLSTALAQPRRGCANRWPAGVVILEARP